MEITAASALQGNFNGIPGDYMTANASGMMIQANGRNVFHIDVNADSMCIIDAAQFELPLCMSTTETSLYSNSSEVIERLYQLDQGKNIYHPQSINAADNLMSMPQSIQYRPTAFVSYLRPAHSLCVNTGKQDLMKRSFNFLRNVYEKKREAQRLSQCSDIQETHKFDVSVQNKAAFHHMLAERNRRVKLKQHFSLLQSLLPRNSKRDKYSVLSNIINYMSELKRREDELQQRNRALEESLKRIISEKEGCSSLGPRHDEHLTNIVYSSDEVVLAQSENISNQLEIRINVQIDPLSSPTGLVILLLQRLRELQLEVVSVETDIETFKFQVHLVIKQIEGYKWERSDWENLAEMVRQTLI